MRVCVEGNIACGKSTALGILKSTRPDLDVYTEPVEEWGELFTNFYDNPTKWALAFSLRVLLSFRAPAKSRGDRVLVERSCLSCRHVFSQMLFNEGKLTQQEWNVFKEYCDVLAWDPDIVVYVHTPPEVCEQRMRQRDRPEERGIDVHHLKRLDFQYETMLRFANVRVVRVDGTMPPDAVAQAIAAAFEEE